MKEHSLFPNVAITQPSMLDMCKRAAEHVSRQFMGETLFVVAYHHEEFYQFEITTEQTTRSHAAALNSMYEEWCAALRGRAAMDSSWGRE